MSDDPTDPIEVATNVIVGVLTGTGPDHMYRPGAERIARRIIDALVTADVDLQLLDQDIGSEVDAAVARTVEETQLRADVTQLARIMIMSDVSPAAVQRLNKIIDRGA
jgi:hypothetical protein